MGGSGGGGGGYFGSEPPEKLAEMVRQEQLATKGQTFDAEVSAQLHVLLAKHNDRNAESVNAHLDEVAKALEKESSGHVDFLFGGSVAKRTYVAGLSDVDSIVILDDSSLGRKKPSAVVEYFCERLKDRFPKTDVVADGFAVTVKFSDGDVQLVPGLRAKGDALRIPSDDVRGWRTIDPAKFRDALTSINVQMASKVVPVIKLAKAINGSLPEPVRLSGYHVEALGVEIFHGYAGAKNTKAMLQHFIDKLPERVKEPIADVTGQSTNVDDYLGPARSAKRETVSAAYRRVARRLLNAEGAKSVDQWIDVVKGGT